MWTGTTPTVLAVRFFWISAKLTPMDEGSKSRKMGLPPAKIMGLTVAMKVLVGTNTSLPATPMALIIISRAAPPLEQATACLVPA